MPDDYIGIANCVFVAALGLSAAAASSRYEANQHNNNSIEQLLRRKLLDYVPNRVEVERSWDHPSKENLRVTEIFYNGDCFNVTSERVKNNWLTDLFEFTRHYKALEVETPKV
jgi:hypothetical protein